VWRIRVTNKSSVPATEVTIVEFTERPSESATPVSIHASQGRCTFAACNLGTIAPGASATVVAVLRANTIGIVANTVQARPAETDSNPTNNTDSAVVRVIGQFAPPVVIRCDSLTVTPRVLREGVRTIAIATARDRRGRPLEGLPVKVRGSGVDSRATTDRNGRARFTLSPRKGLIRVTALGQRALLLRPRSRCATLLGVLGSGSPPSVTG
jgi:hypothetical protein